MRVFSRALLGRPLPTSAQGQERLTKTAAIGAFGLDALSSVAYGPDEILYVLLLAGSAGLVYDIPIAVGIALLLGIVAFSYRQTIHAYPNGGGSFTVASRNLGRTAGLFAAGALMVDYLTTVAVSVTAGVAALIAFAPGLNGYRVVLDVTAIVVLMGINLRGVREAGAAFILPTYVFVISLAALLILGAVRIATGHAPAPLHALPTATEGLSLFLVLRAFAGGCTAMTGVEAIANGVPAFQPPESDNAARTLTALAVVLGALFLGVAVLGRTIGAVPTDETNVIAQIGQAMAPNSPLFFVVQISSAAILLLAANTSFNGFPRLAAVMARDEYFPRQFSHRGVRLAYSNGIIVIGLLAIALVIIFGGSTHALIPLFAVGVFLCFTLSQAGMVVHWVHNHESRWRLKLTINALGAVTTGAVAIIVASTKFLAGAWIVLLLVPLLAGTFWGIHRHYRQSHEQLANVPRRHALGKQRVIVPVHDLDRATAAAVEYALSITDAERITAVHVRVEEEEEGGNTARPDDTLPARWKRWAPSVELRIIKSPYREVINPVIEVIEACQREGDDMVTVVIPDVLAGAWYQVVLHNQLEIAFKLALLYHPGVVVTSVPFRLRE
jgi:amino acid transporter